LELHIGNAIICDDGVRVLRKNREHPEAFQAWIVLYFDGSISVHFSEKKAFEESACDLDSFVQEIVWDNPEFLSPDGAIN